MIIYMRFKGRRRDSDRPGLTDLRRKVSWKHTSHGNGVKCRPLAYKI